MHREKSSKTKASTGLLRYKHKRSVLNMDLPIFAFVLFLFLDEIRAQFQPAQPCEPEKCVPPDCRCSDNRNPPGGLRPEQTPQIIMVTFDDDLEKQYLELYNEFFDGVTNPNSCPAVGTLFISHNYTNYFLVESEYSKGYEEADHTITHQEPTTYWEDADYTVWKNEIDGQREILHR